MIVWLHLCAMASRVNSALDTKDGDFKLERGVDELMSIPKVLYADHNILATHPTKSSMSVMSRPQWLHEIALTNRRLSFSLVENGVVTSAEKKQQMLKKKAPQVLLVSQQGCASDKQMFFRKTVCKRPKFLANVGGRDQFWYNRSVC